VGTRRKRGHPQTSLRVPPQEHGDEEDKKRRKSDYDYEDEDEDDGRRGYGDHARAK